MIKAHYDKCVEQTRTSEPQQQSAYCPVPDPKHIIMETNPTQAQKHPTTSHFGPAPSAKHQADLNSHVFHTPVGTKDDLDKKIAEFVFVCNLPLIVVEYPRFNAMLSSPGYKPPISNKWLEKCHDKYQAIMKQQLNNKTLSMRQDSWSTIQNDPVIPSTVVSQGKGFFVDA